MAESDFIENLLIEAERTKNPHLKKRIAAQRALWRGRQEGKLQYPPAPSSGLTINPGDPLYIRTSAGRMPGGYPSEFTPSFSLQQYMADEGLRKSLDISIASEGETAPVAPAQKGKKKKSITERNDEIIDLLERLR